MEESKYSGCVTKLNYYMAALLFDICLALVVWVVLIVLRGANVINMHWAIVYSSVVWISICLFILTVLLDVFMRYLRRSNRRRRLDVEIIRQAKESGEWDNPEILKSRALELYLWKNYRIKRKPGELDNELRKRYKTLL